MSVPRKGVAILSLQVVYDAVEPHGGTDEETTALLDSIIHAIDKLIGENPRLDRDSGWEYEPYDDDDDEPLQCHRCGARYAEDPSCGKSIHLDLPSRDQ